jgi:hypothetical protein
MKYYEKQTDSDTLIMSVAGDGNFSIASKNSPEPDGFVGPSDPFGRGYVEVIRERAEEILGYDPGE